MKSSRGDDGASVALGVDIGSTNVKAALVAVDSAGVARELIVRSLPTPDSATELLTSVAALIRGILAATRVTPAVIGVASMAETGVALDADDQPLTPLIRWNGARDPIDAVALAERYGAEALFSATGVPPGPKAPLAVWWALRRSQPELWRRMARWSGVADLVTLSLTGNLVTDHTLAGRTMAYRLPSVPADLPSGFDPELLAIVGLRAEQLPRVAPPGEIAGRVSRDAARATGLAAGTPVVIAGHDHAVGAWASGVRRPGEIADSVGTSEALLHVLIASANRPVIAASGMSLARTVGGTHECLIAGSANAGAMIAWWLAELNVAEPLEVLSAAGERGRGPTGLLVLPYLAGRQTPRPDRQARLQLIDRQGHPIQIGSREPVELTRALLEGLALHLRWMDAEQRQLAAEPVGSFPGQPIMVLGASGIAGWIRVKAAVMPAALRAVTATEPVASGAALLAAVRLGMVPESVVLPSRPIEAEPDHGKIYDGMYADFVSAAIDESSTGTPTGAATSVQGDR